MPHGPFSRMRRPSEMHVDRDQIKRTATRRRRGDESDDSWLPLLAACLLGLTVLSYLCTSYQLNYDEEGALTDISAQRRDATSQFEPSPN